MANRQHYWDLVRAGLMLFGIPYHAALIYGGGDWFVSAPGSEYAFDVVSGLTRSFRMPAFFIIAGFFAGLLLSRRSPRDWFAGRLLKLGLPLATCVALLSPLQMLIAASAAHATTGASISDLMWSQLTTPGVHWLRHLWFLVALLWMCVGLAAAHDRFPALSRWRLPERAETFAARNFNLAMGIFAAGLSAYTLAAIHILRETGAGSHPIAQLLAIKSTALHVPYFLVGFLMSRSTEVLDRFTRPNPAFWICGIAALLAFALLWRQDGTGMKIALKVLSSISGLMMSHVLLSAARRWLDRPSTSVTEMVNASFVIYLTHQPIVAGLGLAFLFLHLPPFIEFAAICLLTLCVSFGLAKAVQAVPVLNLLLNGVTRAETNTRAKGLTASA